MNELDYIEFLLNKCNSRNVNYTLKEISLQFKKPCNFFFLGNYNDRSLQLLYQLFTNEKVLNLFDKFCEGNNLRYDVNCYYLLDCVETLLEFTDDELEFIKEFDRYCTEPTYVDDNAIHFSTDKIKVEIKSHEDINLLYKLLPIFKQIKFEEVMS